MYAKRAWNVAILATSTALLLVFWVAIRQQVAITDREFLKSMILYHAGTILMCEKTRLKAPKELCASIIASQQAEIDKMKAWLGKDG